MPSIDVFHFQVPSDANPNDVRLQAVNVPIGANASIVESSDLLNTTAALAIQANASITEGVDSLSAAAAISIQASAAITEGADSVSSTAVLPLAASATITEGADAISATASVSIAANAAITEGADTLLATGAVSLQASANITENADVVSATAVLPITANAAIIEDADIVLSALLQQDFTYKPGTWLPIKYLGGKKKPPEDAPQFAITKDELASYLALNAKVDDGRAARAEIIRQMQDDIMAEINRAQILQMAGQASQLMAQEEGEMDLLLLST
jgi:hypothetical protein